MANNQVRYKPESDGKEYKCWIGAWITQPHIRGHIQKFSVAEAAVIKAEPLTCIVQDSDWNDVNVDQQMFNLAVKNNADIMRRLLPKKEELNVSDFENLALFKNKHNNQMKAVLRNKKTNEFWLLSCNDQVPDTNHTGAVEDGWYVYASLMIAPAAFFARFRDVI